MITCMIYIPNSQGSIACADNISVQVQLDKVDRTPEGFHFTLFCRAENKQIECVCEVCVCVRREVCVCGVCVSVCLVCVCVSVRCVCQ